MLIRLLLFLHPVILSFWGVFCASLTRKGDFLLTSVFTFFPVFSSFFFFHKCVTLYILEGKPERNLFLLGLNPVEKSANKIR